MNRFSLFVLAVPLIVACAWVPPHENLDPHGTQWRQKVGAMK